MSYIVNGTSYVHRFLYRGEMCSEILFTQAAGNTPFCEGVEDFVTMVVERVDFPDEEGVFCVQGAARIFSYTDYENNIDVDGEVLWSHITHATPDESKDFICLYREW